MKLGRILLCSEISDEHTGERTDDANIYATRIGSGKLYIDNSNVIYVIFKDFELYQLNTVISFP